MNTYIKILLSSFILHSALNAHAQREQSANDFFQSMPSVKAGSAPRTNESELMNLSIQKSSLSKPYPEGLRRLLNQGAQIVHVFDAGRSIRGYILRTASNYTIAYVNFRGDLLTTPLMDGRRNLTELHIREYAAYMQDPFIQDVNVRQQASDRLYERSLNYAPMSMYTPSASNYSSCGFGCISPWYSMWSNTSSTEADRLRRERRELEVREEDLRRRERDLVRMQQNQRDVATAQLRREELAVQESRRRMERQMHEQSVAQKSSSTLVSAIPVVDKSKENSKAPSISALNETIPKPPLPRSTVVGAVPTPSGKKVENNAHLSSNWSREVSKSEVTSAAPVPLQPKKPLENRDAVLAPAPKNKIDTSSTVTKKADPIALPPKPTVEKAISPAPPPPKSAPPAPKPPPPAPKPPPPAPKPPPPPPPKPSSKR